MDTFIVNDKKARAWLLLSFGDQRKHLGNYGYADKVSREYQYDSLVPNHKQITEGDWVVLSDKKQLIGIARICKITNEQWEKPLQRCPLCQSTKINARRKKKPLFRCIKCHQEFDIPIVKPEPCQKFIADFGNTFEAVEKIVKIEELRRVCPKYNKQFAMQLIDLEKIRKILFKNGVEDIKLLNLSEDSEYIENINYLKADDSYEDDYNYEYIPTPEDSREIIFQQIRKRRGQSKFRNSLRQRYDDQCMISGCQIIDILEAAHISSYRGADDNHPDNGLLLRADLHTLFDIDLLGINPDSLEVELHPKLITSSYQEFAGKKLIFSKLKPSKSALEIKWSLFCRRKEVKN